MERGEGHAEVKQKKKRRTCRVANTSKGAYSFKKWYSKGAGVTRDMVKVQSWGGRGRLNGTQNIQPFAQTSEGGMYIHTDTYVCSLFAHTNHMYEKGALHLCTPSLTTQIQRQSFKPY